MTTPTITIDAGAHKRHNCPIEFSLPTGITAGSWRLVGNNGASLSIQVDPDGRARGVVPHLPSNTSLSFRMEPGRADDSSSGVAVENREGALTISVGGEIVTRYVYADVPARPYFHPVHAPGQVPVTRAYPMIPDADGETRDHPHHRSLWIAFGEVNGADNWSEAEGHACTRHVRFDSIANGSEAGSFSAHSRWETTEGDPLLTERLQVVAWSAGTDIRLLDFAIALEASHGDVHFGDTKEGGILSIRVASELDVPRTGRITNVYGGVDESETWGKASHWCDYSGTVGGLPVGIAVFDHPDSFRYPTHWHVRNYGLMTANPFGYSAYTNGRKDGSHTLRSGDTLFFRYRVALHRDSCEQAQVNAHYLNFVAPPRVVINS
jgi:hypothetical protein